jgi:ribosomal protein S18 acetylase RimI-like enzyme
VFSLGGEEGSVLAPLLYRRAGFRQVGRREGYYPAARGTAALILRRDLV